MDGYVTELSMVLGQSEQGTVCFQSGCATTKMKLPQK